MPEENKDVATDARHIISPSEFVPLDNSAEFQEYLVPDASSLLQPEYRMTFAPPPTLPPYSFPISTPGQVANPPKKRISGIFMAVLALLIVAGAGGGLLLFSSHLRTPALQSAGIHVNQNNLTSTTQAPTTPLVIYQQALNGTPIINDPLNDASTSTWHNSTHPTPTGHCAFGTDGYHIVETKNDTFYFCTSSGSYFVHFAFQVQMTILRGDAGGVVFHTTNRVDQFSLYHFRIDQDGRYGLYLHTGRSVADVKTLIAGSSNAINTGPKQANVITVIDSGNTIYMYVNGLFVANVKDTSLSGGGIGLTASDFSNPADVVFQNAKVWTV